MITMVREDLGLKRIFTESLVSFLGKWDLVTGINSPLYRSHAELEEHEDWKNSVSIGHSSVNG